MLTKLVVRGKIHTRCCMINGIIERCLDYNGYLINFNGKRIDLSLEFYGIDKPCEGAQITLDEKLLDKKSKEYTQPYSFEFVKNMKSGERIADKMIILQINGENFVLKRVYG